MRINFITALVVCGILVASGAQAQESQTPGWGFGAELGGVVSTPDGEVFAIQITGDKYLRKAFSMGFLTLFSPIGDLTQIAGAATGKWHMVVSDSRFRVSPFLGLGLWYSDFLGNDDVGFYIPIGVTGGYEVSPDIDLTATFVINLHDLTFNAPIGDDPSSYTIVFGVRFRP